jgi:hypothetical protein
MARKNIYPFPKTFTCPRNNREVMTSNGPIRFAARRNHLNSALPSINSLFVEGSGYFMLVVKDRQFGDII